MKEINVLRKEEYEELTPHDLAILYRDGWSIEFQDDICLAWR
jgi:hypothetical protein